MIRVRFPHRRSTALCDLALLLSLCSACGASDNADDDDVARDQRTWASQVAPPVETTPGETCDGAARKATRVHHVTPTGKASATGDSFTDALDLTTALARVAPGEAVLLAPGTYPIAYTPNAKNTITLAKSGTEQAPIAVVVASCGRAVIDFSFPEQTWVQDSFGFLLKGSYWYFRGLDITRAGYQGVYVTGQHNTFEHVRFFDNRNSGLEINKGGAYTTVINSDAFRNYDPKKLGGMADGFASKQTQGPGNRFIGCRAWENSDDGYDTFDSAEVVIIEDSWAFDNGIDVWKYGNFSGNGNGFKIGGNYKLANNRVLRSVAFGNRVKGFDQNHNVGGITLHHCLGYKNGINFGLGGELTPGEQNDLKNNISLDAPDSIANAITANNSWNDGFAVTAADFVSLDTSEARRARNPEGALPTSPLFQLAPASALVDRGVDLGLPFSGSAPDLGPFERAQKSEDSSMRSADRQSDEPDQQGQARSGQ